MDGMDGLSVPQPVWSAQHGIDPSQIPIRLRLYLMWPLTKQTMNCIGYKCSVVVLSGPSGPSVRYLSICLSGITQMPPASCLLLYDLLTRHTQALGEEKR